MVNKVKMQRRIWRSRNRLSSAGERAGLSMQNTLKVIGLDATVGASVL